MTTTQRSYGSFIVDGSGVIVGFDENLERLTGWPAVDLVGRHKDAIRSAAENSIVTGETLRLYDGPLRTGLAASRAGLTMYSREGRTLEVEALVERLSGPGERILVNVVEVLARSASHGVAEPDRRDSLTGLLDGNGFASRLAADFAEASVRAKPLALMLVDVDRFREINDRRGRAAGSDALRKLADILRVLVEDERRVARLGEDDFAVLLRRAGRGDARQLAATIRSTVERYAFFDETPSGVPQMTVSIGAASFPADADRAHELMERAREALNEARSMGRNRVWCYLRRPRVPVQVPVFFDGAEALLVGYSRDLSPSGVFIQTTAAIGVGMRCALTFPLPGNESKVHVIGRVVRAVPPELTDPSSGLRIPGIGVEFERFGGNSDRRAIESFLHRHETETLRPERQAFSVTPRLAPARDDAETLSIEPS